MNLLSYFFENIDIFIILYKGLSSLHSLKGRHYFVCPSPTHEKVKPTVFLASQSKLSHVSQKEPLDHQVLHIQGDRAVSQKEWIPLHKR